MKHRLLFGFLLALVSLFWVRTGAAATITTSVLNGPNFCQNTAVRVGFSVSGSLDPSNMFTAQLSDETGSFAAPVAIGLLAGTAGGTIVSTLPANVVTGSGYRVRVVASNAVTIGTDNGQDLTITNIGTVTAGSNSPLCTGGNLLLMASTVPGASYAWTGPNNFASMLQNPTIANVGVNRSGTYTVTASANGCSATSSVTVTVNALPNASVTPQNAVICAGQSVTLNASGGTSYSWSPATGLSSSTVANPTASPTASTIYTVTVTNAAGCSSTAQSTVNVRATPVLTVSPNTTICTGSSTTLSVSGAQNYTWSPSTGLNNPRSATPIASPTTTTTYTITGDNGNCSATATVTVTVEPLPTPNAGPDRVLCSGQSAQLGSAPVAGLTYSWSPSTGLSSTSSAQPTVTLTNTGTAPRTTVYTLTAVSATGCVGSSAVRVTVNPTVTTNAGAAQTFCSGDSAPLGGTAPVAGYTYSWNPITGVANATAAQTTVSLTNTTGAPIITTYTLTASSNGCSNTSTVQVTVNPATSAAFAYNAASYCQSSANPTPTISGTAGGVFTSATGLSINASTGQINLAASTAGTYTIAYTVSGTCSATASASVTITTAPVASFSYPTTSYCAAAQGNVAPVFSGGASAGTFTSITGLSLDPATGVVNLAASTAGTYTVTNTIAASGSCAATTATAAITISPAPVAVISAGGSMAICQGTSVLLTATGGGAGATYQFLLNGQAIAGATASSYAASAAGSYAVVVTSASGCSATSAATAVTVNPATSAAFSYPAIGYCISSPTSTPSITGTAGGTFTSTAGLSLNASTGAIAPAASTPGTYTVTYSVGGTCPSSSTATLTISAPASAAFNYGSATLCASGTATLTLAMGASAGVFSSTIGLVLNATTGAIDLVASTPGTYTVTNTVSSTSACGGTSATATVTLNALPTRPMVAAQYNGPTTTLTSSASTGNQWYLNGTAVVGATGPTYVVSSAAQLGSYTVTTTDPTTGCISLPSAPLVVTATARQLADAALQLYPNPTPDGKLTVTLSSGHQAVQLSVLNALGQVVYRVAVPASAAAAQPLDLSALPTGVYLLRATTADGTATRRFVRE